MQRELLLLPCRGQCLITLGAPVPNRLLQGIAQQFRQALRVRLLSLGLLNDLLGWLLSLQLNMRQLLPITLVEQIQQLFR